MIRSALGKVAWVGRTASMVLGLALVMALVIGAASAAWSATGGNFILGKGNAATTPTSLISTLADTAKSALIVQNKSGGAALDLKVGNAATPANDVAPMKVNSTKKVAKLNADRIDDREASSFANGVGGVATNADLLDGKDFSAFGAKNVMDTYGPLPKEATYTSKGGTLIISASGSGYRDTNTHGLIGMIVYIDGAQWGWTSVYTNEKNSHKAFVDDYIVVSGLPAGEHTIRLGELSSQPWAAQQCGTASETDQTPCTTTDGNDRFQVVVVEIPA